MNSKDILDRRLLKTAAVVFLTTFSGLVLNHCGDLPAASYKNLVNKLGQNSSYGNLGLMDGDIIFHKSKSRQSRAIQVVTGSPYSHMGLIFIEHGQPIVYEAVQPVKKTALDDFIARGERSHFVIKRLRDRMALTTDGRAWLKKVARSMLGRPYDARFEWTDEKIYCSEFVYKAYAQALNIKIGQMQTLGQFDLNDPMVRAMVRRRFGQQIPIREKVISPAAMFHSDKLYTVHFK